MTTVYGKLNNLLTAANAATGESDTTLTDAVQTLIDGYGQGGGGWTTDGIADGSEPSGALTITENVHQYALYDRDFITSVTLSCTSIGMFGFAYSGGLQSASSTTVTTINEGAFRECTGLTSISFPNATSITGRYIFENTRMTTVVLPKVTSNIAQQAFNKCSNLQTIDLNAPGALGSNSLANCPLLTTVILRKSSVVTLQYANCFNATPFASGGSGGEIYVPQALLATYPTSTNWSTINGYGTVTWKAIEGSYYETHYADGTVIA